MQDATSTPLSTSTVIATNIDSPTPQPIDTATITPTPEPTFTPTITPTPKPTSLPLPSEKITAENITSLQEIGQWGEGVITDVALSPDGQLLATAKPTGIYVYDATSLEFVVYVEGRGIRNIQFFPDGSTLVSSGNDLTRLWSTSDWTETSTFESTNLVAISPDGQKIAFVNQTFDPVNVSLKVFDATNGEEMFSKTNSNYIDALQFGTLKFLVDNNTLILQTLHQVTLIDTTTGQTTIKKEINNKSIVAMSLILDSNILVLHTVSGDDSIIELLEWETGKLVTRLFGANSGSTMAVSHDGKYITVGDYEGYITTWDIETRERLYSQWIGTGVSIGQDIMKVLFNLEGTSLITQTRGGRVIWFDVSTGVEQKQLYSNARHISHEPFSPQASLLATSFQNEIIMWNLNENLHWKTITHTREIQPPLFSPDGATLIATDFLATHSWNVIEGTQGASMTGFLELAISPNSQWLLAGVNSWPNSRIVVSNIEDGTVVHENAGIFARGASFSSDGVLFAVSGDPGESIVIANTNTWEQQIAIPIGNYYLRYLAFTPDSKFLFAYATDAGTQTSYQIRIWNVQDGHVVKNITLPFRPCAIDYLLDESIIAFASQNGMIHFINANSGEQLHVIDLGRQTMSTFSCEVAFSPDGRLLATELGGVVRLWALPVDGIELMKDTQLHPKS